MLILALVMLVLITLVSASNIRTTTMNEKMAGNARDRNRALQAAEGAVRACISPIVAATASAPYTGPKMSPTTPPAAAAWEVASNWSSAAASSVSVDASLSSPAQCLIEDLGGESYRVTGRASGGSPDTTVILQATVSNE